ncbi:MAG: hypothetical protein FJ272_22125 [Planctomycetes bacterium]|nr:hypothetical protein [Planctomycetota bacterium]
MNRMHGWTAAWGVLLVGLLPGLSAGKDVSLVVTNAPVSDAVRQLQRESGYPIQFYWGGGEGKRVTLDLRNVPFFRALGELAKAAGCSYDSWRPGEFSLMPGRAKDPPIHIEGPFRFAMLSIAREMDLTFGGRAEPTLRLALELMWEPDAQVVGANDTLNVALARSGEGQALAAVSVLADTRTRYSQSSYYGGLKRSYMAYLKPPEAAGGELAELRGFVTLTVCERMDEVRFENPTRADNEKRKTGEAEITLYSLSREGDHYTALVGLPASLPGQRSGSGQYTTQMSGAELILVDDAGQQHRSQGVYSTSSSTSAYRQSVRMGMRFPELPAGRKPVALIYRYPAATRDVDVGFEFKNLPLP